MLFILLTKSENYVLIIYDVIDKNIYFFLHFSKNKRLFHLIKIYGKNYLTISLAGEKNSIDTKMIH